MDAKEGKMDDAPGLPLKVWCSNKFQHRSTCLGGILDPQSHTSALSQSLLYNE